MERSRGITVVLLLTVAVFACAAGGKASSTLLQEGLYAEEVDGDLDAAIKLYQQIIDQHAAQRSHAAQAMYRLGMCHLKKQDEARAREVFARVVADYGDQTRVVEKVKPLLEELINGDPAALMPPETLLYIELGSPGKQVETILKMLEGTPLENPLAAIGADKGDAQPGPQNILAGLLNPSMMAEFKKIRGVGVGITGVAQDDPPVIVVLYPGKSDALRGLLMAALSFAGKPGETIEGMQTVVLNDGGGVAHDDTTIILASPKAYEAGQLAWSVKQHKGLTSEPTLASSNRSFARVSKKDRQENALTIWAKVDEVFAALKSILPAGDMPKEIKMADQFVDLENVDDLLAFVSMEEDKIAVETNINFKDGHQSVAYNLIRTGNLSKSALSAVPSEAVGLISLALPGADSPGAGMITGKLKENMGLDIGGDFFDNVDQITLFVTPPAGETPPGIPPIAMSLGVVMTSDEPQQTKQILTGLLKGANLLGESQPANTERAGRYQLNLVNGASIQCYANQASKATVLSLNPAVIDAAVSAVGDRKSVTSSGKLKEAVNTLSPRTSKVALINVGGMLGFVEADESVSDLLGQVADSCDKTTVRLRTLEEQNSFNVRAEISGLPPVGRVIGPAMELAKLIQQAKARSVAEARKGQIPGVIRHTDESPEIDGKAEDLWSGIRRHRIRNTVYTPAADRSDLTAFYRAMWDQDNLYILVNVMDESLKNDSDEFYLDDCVEIFVDSDNSKSPGYGDNDYQYFFKWAEANPQMGETRHGKTDGVEFAVGQADVGYRVEIKFPWATFGTNPALGTKIGIDVHVNDDDDGGDRDTKIMWRGKQDNAWQTTEALGTSYLAGLIGRWKFDGDADDSSGNANHGAEVGNPTYVAGKFGKAVSFDGRADRIEVPATIAENPELYPARAASASAWVKTTMPADDTFHSVIRHEFHFTPLQTHPEGGWVVAFADEDGTRVARTKHFDWCKLNDGRWHHYVATYNGGVCEVWIDGTREASDNRGAFSLWTRDNQPWVFGGRERGEGGGEYYTGQLDDVRLYSYALSENEIEALHNEGK